MDPAFRERSIVSLAASICLMPEGFDKPAGRLSASRAVRSPLPASWIKACNDNRRSIHQAAPTTGPWKTPVARS